MSAAPPVEANGPGARTHSPEAVPSSRAKARGRRRSDQRPRLEELFHFLWTYGLPAVSVIGLLMYGLLRQLYAHFYGSLGASPEEVGLGYSEILALSGIGFIGVIVLPLVIAGALVFTIRRFTSTPDPRDVVLWLAVPLAVLSAIAGTWSLVHSTWDLTTKAYNGVSVTSVNLGPLQLLGLRAEPATVRWTGSATPPDPALDNDTCLLYLGQANGISVFFDPGPPVVRTIRVQTADVVVEVARASGAPGEHQQGGVHCDSNHRVAFAG